MQLFRQQAIDHQQRLYGEVLLVPPLRWSAILGLWLLLLATLAALLAWGSYSDTIAVGGTSLPGGRVTFDVPTSAIARVAVGQPVRLLGAASDGKRRIVHGVIERVASPPAGGKGLFMPVTARLTGPDKPAPDSASPLPAGAAIDARIVLAPRPLLQWILAPTAREATP